MRVGCLGWAGLAVWLEVGRVGYIVIKLIFWVYGYMVIFRVSVGYILLLIFILLNQVEQPWSAPFLLLIIITII
jgi:hypothetical protein